MISFSFSWSFTHCNFSSYNVGTLSKDHAGYRISKGLKTIPYIPLGLTAVGVVSLAFNFSATLVK